MKVWLGNVITRLGQIVITFEDLVIEWLTKLKSAKILVAVGIIVCCFIVVGFTMWMIVYHPDKVAKNTVVVTTVFGLTELLAGGVVGWLFKLRKDEKVNGNEINGNVKEVNGYFSN